MSIYYDKKIRTMFKENIQSGCYEIDVSQTLMINFGVILVIVFKLENKDKTILASGYYYIQDTDDKVDFKYFIKKKNAGCSIS